MSPSPFPDDADPRYAGGGTVPRPGHRPGGEHGVGGERGGRWTVAGAASGLAALGSLGCTGLWAIGWLVSDRAEWSQYIAYVPSIVLAGAAWGAAVVAGVFALVDRAWRGAHGLPRRRHTLARLAFALAVAAAAKVAWLDLRLVNRLAPRGAHAGERVLRLAHWNTGALWRDTWPDVLRALPDGPDAPDVIVLSNPPQPSDLPGFEAAVAGGGGGEVVRLGGGFAVSSRWKVLDTGWFALGIPLAKSAGYPTFLPPGSLVARAARAIVPLRVPRYPDDGDVGFVRLDARADLGREVVLWVIDLPSDPRLPREVVARAVAARLAELRARGQMPAPDLLVGDFNIPRGTWAQRLIADAAGTPRHAFDDAGSGLMATWPRERPALAIDQILLAPGWRAAAYGLVDGGASDHVYQTAELVCPP